MNERDTILRYFGESGAVMSHAIPDADAEALIQGGFASRASISEDGRNGVRPHTDYFVVLTHRGLEAIDSAAKRRGR
jgi:hypothetical protein